MKEIVIGMNFPRRTAAENIDQALTRCKQWTIVSS